MRILGIHDGHTSTACLVENGKIKGSVSEERFTRVKGQGGFPTRSVEYLETLQVTESPFDYVALVGYVQPLVSISEYKRGRQKFFPLLSRFLPVDPRWLIRNYVASSRKTRLANSALQNALVQTGLAKVPIHVVEHHQCHAAVAYYLSPFATRKEPTLVMTLDGSGDGLSGTVSTVDATGRWERLKEISTFDSLGVVFSRTTQYLAMRPWEHEYKLMGMAPYASAKRAEEVAQILSKYIGLSDDGLSLKNPGRLWGNAILEDMHNALRGQRFDSVAAGVQLLHEKLTVQLVHAWLKKTGMRNLAVGGGCFMNIKANRLLLDLPECRELFVMPSCGDESCALGAALQVHADQGHSKTIPIEPLADLYWGPEYTESDIVDTLRTYSSRVEFKKSANIESESADLLAKHKILGRLSGRMEWGQRSLGNRSIIANPSNIDNLRKLNSAVKMRDFWMPFAPSILWEKRHDYAHDPYETEAYHMTLGFESTPKAQTDIPAALHPYDRTMRPQFVKKEHNPKYHALITEFEKKTGIGGVLNTSFNLHGYPIVCHPADAIKTLLNSAIDYVTLGDYLVWKRA